MIVCDNCTGGVAERNWLELHGQDCDGEEEGGNDNLDGCLDLCESCRDMFRDALNNLIGRWREGRQLHFYPLKTEDDD